MNEEQIKQNAEDIVNALTIRPEACIYSRSNMISAAIAGAHSRDEEIKGYQAQINMTADALQRCMDELNQLRNPWISVEEQLPEIEDEKEERTGEVFVCIKDDVYLVAHYSYFYKAWYAFSDKGGCMYRKIRTPRYWMPIPELKKENKQ